MVEDVSIDDLIKYLTSFLLTRNRQIQLETAFTLLLYLSQQKVIPLHKKGHKAIDKNYRPIAMLPKLSLILEKIVQTQISHNKSQYPISTATICQAEYLYPLHKY